MIIFSNAQHQGPIQNFLWWGSSVFPTNPSSCPLPTCLWGLKFWTVSMGTSCLLTYLKPAQGSIGLHLRRRKVEFSSVSLSAPRMTCDCGFSGIKNLSSCQTVGLPDSGVAVSLQSWEIRAWSRMEGSHWLPPLVFAGGMLAEVALLSCRVQLVTVSFLGSWVPAPAGGMPWGRNSSRKAWVLDSFLKLSLVNSTFIAPGMCDWESSQSAVSDRSVSPVVSTVYFWPCAWF